jgi:alpha-glucoside transport system permease protein
MSDMTVTGPIPLADMPIGTKVTMGRKLSDTLGTRAGRAFVWTLAILWTVPTFGLLLTSFRPEKQIKNSGWWTAFAHPSTTFDNYFSVLGARSGIELGRYFANSIKIAVPAAIISVMVAALASYALSWMTFRGREAIYVGIISLLVVPLQMAIIPLLRLFNLGVHIGSTTVVPALHFPAIVQTWIAHACFGMPFCLFILKNFVSALPQELIEAGKIDGAGHMTIFRRIVLPLSVPAIASLGIFQFLYIWNDFFVGKIFAGGGQNAPITAKLVEVSGNRGQDWHLLTAAAFISAIVPLTVFFSLQKYFVKGLLAGSVKG